MKRNTLWARQRNERRLAIANQSHQFCQRRSGRYLCRGHLETVVGRDGRTVTTCPHCERRKRGICRDCPKPVAGGLNAIRCAGCRDRATRQSIKACATRNAPKYRRNQRRRYQENDALRDRRNTYKRAYRKVARAQTKKEKYRAAVRHNAAREKMLAWHRQYNAAKRAGLWIPTRPTRHTAAGERLCWTDTCRSVVTGRTKKCAACKAREAREAQALIARGFGLGLGRGYRSDLRRAS